MQQENPWRGTAIENTTRWGQTMMDAKDSLIVDKAFRGVHDEQVELPRVGIDVSYGFEEFEKRFQPWIGGQIPYPIGVE